MSLFLQLIFNGLIAGSIYALVASGFSLIYNTNKFAHFAHGVSVVIAGYILYTFFSIAGFSFVYSLIFTLFYSAFIGLLIYAFVYMPLQNRKASSVILLISSIAVLILFQNIIQMVYGTDVKDLAYIEIKEGVNLFGAIITPLQVVIIDMSILICFFLLIFMKKTKLGRDMRAVSDNRELASIAGINYKKTYAMSFLIGSFLAGIAGVLIALEQNINPTIGTTLIIKGFTGAVIGGMSSVPAAVLGSYLIGLTENLGMLFLPSAYKDAISFVLLFIFLLFRPQGLVGEKKR